MNDVIERIICRGAFLFARVMLAQKTDRLNYRLSEKYREIGYIGQNSIVKKEADRI